MPGTKYSFKSEGAGRGGPENYEDFDVDYMIERQEREIADADRKYGPGNANQEEDYLDLLSDDEDDGFQSENDNDGDLSDGDEDRYNESDEDKGNENDQGPDNPEYEDEKEDKKEEKKRVPRRKLREFENEEDTLSEIRRLINTVDDKEYLNNKGKLSTEFNDSVKGYFWWSYRKPVNGIQQGVITLTMDNLQSEYYMGLMILRQLRKITNQRLFRGKRNINGYLNQPILVGVIGLAWLDNIKFIKTRRIRAPTGRGRRPVVRVVNPETKYDVKVGTKTFKKLFGEMILKDIVKDITNINTIDYAIKGNCVKSYITEYYGKDICKKYISNKPTYPEIMKMCKELDINFTASTRTGVLIDSYKTNKRKRLDIVISNEHMYVKDNIKYRGKKEIEYEKYKDIVNNENSKIIIKDEKEFENVKRKLNTKYELSDYNDNEIKFKTNEIILNEDYDNLVEYREIHNHNTPSIYSIIGRVYNLHGYMNSYTFDYFNEISSIIHFQKYTEYKCSIRVDGNKQYVSQLYNRLLPVPNVNDYIRKYDNHKLTEGTFYYCKLKKYNILGFDKDEFYYYDCVIELKKHNYIKEITHYLSSSDTVKIESKHLPPLLYKKNGEEIVNDESFLTEYIREYIGSLRKTETCITHTYDSIKNEEARALKLIHPNNYYTEGKFTITDEFKKYKTGILAWIAIVQCANLSLFLFDNEIRKLNKNVELVAVRTDSLSYMLDNKYKLPTDMIKSNTIGKFKIEYVNEVCKKDIGSKLDEGIINIERVKEDVKDNINKIDIIRNQDKMEIPVCLRYRLNKVDKDQITSLLKNKESFIINGFAGLGKTYQLRNTIIPYFKEHKYKYLLSSTTIQQANDLQKHLPDDVVHRLQMLFSRKKDSVRLDELFKGAHYLVIDEAVQLTQNLLAQLEYIKNTYNIALIALSDKYQCIVDNYDGEPYIDTEFSHKLFDMNIVQLTKHNKMRYSSELYNHLMYIIKNKDEKTKVREYVLKYFKVRKTSKDKINIAYTNSTCDEVANKDTTCITVHSVQGQTIEKSFSFHDIMIAPVNVIYTALSRARAMKQITIIYDSS